MGVPLPCIVSVSPLALCTDPTSQNRPTVKQSIVLVPTYRFSLIHPAIML